MAVKAVKGLERQNPRKLRVDIRRADDCWRDATVWLVTGLANRIEKTTASTREDET
jgi:hypothetical protein